MVQVYLEEAVLLSVDIVWQLQNDYQSDSSNRFVAIVHL